MKGKVVVLLGLAVLMMVVAGLWPRDGRGPSSDRSPERTRAGAAWLAEAGRGEAPTRPPRIAERGVAAPRPTHGAHQLKDFALPAIEIDGLSLAQALERVRDEYQRVCGISGEVPLALGFELAAAGGGPLTLTLSPGGLDRAIRHLGAMAGLRVAREGKVYRFEEDALAGPVERRLAVPPDFASRLQPDPERGGGDLRQALAAAGVPLDPSTRLSFKPSSSTLELETSSAADLARIEGLAAAFGEAPVQTKLEVTLLELPDGTEAWKPGETMRREDLQVRLRDLAAIQGASLQTLPSVTSRSGAQGTIELVRELIAPDPQAESGFTMHQLGQVLEITPSALGFGHGVAFHYTDTEGGLVGGRVELRERVRIEEQAFVGDQRSRVFRHLRDDGSSTLLVLTPTLIDATGRPVGGPGH